MRHHALAIHQKFVAFRLAAEDGMILQHQARLVSAAFAREKQRGRKPADPAAHHHAVVLLAGIGNIGRQRFEDVVANLMRLRHHFVGISVRIAVFAHAAVAGPFGLLRKQLHGAGSGEQSRAGSHQCRVQIIAPSYASIHSEFVASSHTRIISV